MTRSLHLRTTRNVTRHSSSGSTFSIVFTPASAFLFRWREVSADVRFHLVEATDSAVLTHKSRKKWGCFDQYMIEATNTWIDTRSNTCWIAKENEEVPPPNLTGCYPPFLKRFDVAPHPSWMLQGLALSDDVLKWAINNWSTQTFSLGWRRFFGASKGLVVKKQNSPVQNSTLQVSQKPRKTGSPTCRWSLWPDLQELPSLSTHFRHNFTLVIYMNHPKTLQVD